MRRWSLRRSVSLCRSVELGMSGPRTGNPSARRRPGPADRNTSESTPCHHGSVTSRVLVVDDEPIVREVLARYLSRDGFDVDTAEDGEGALEAVDRERPDLIVLDLMLPKVDGLE